MGRARKQIGSPRLACIGCFSYLRLFRRDQLSHHNEAVAAVVGAGGKGQTRSLEVRVTLPFTIDLSCMAASQDGIGPVILKEQPSER